VTAPLEVVRLGDDDIAVEVLPAVGARLHRIRVRGVEVLRTPGDLAVHVDDGWFWGSYPMVPWCNRLPAGRSTAAGRPLDLPSNFFDGTAIHGQVAQAPWTHDGPGTFTIRAGGDGWPWPYEVRQTIEAGGDRFDLHLAVTNLGEAPMPAGVGIHPWFRAPVEVAIRAASVHPSNLDSSPLPEPVHGQLDRRTVGPLAEGVDAAWTDLDDPPVVLAWPADRLRATMTVSDGVRYIVAATLASADATAVEPETHAPAGLRRLARGEPGALALLDPGSTLAITASLRFAFDQT
jgi:aldose 1-epimerase